MLIENAKPLMIIWLPVKALTGLVGSDATNLGKLDLGASWLNDAVDFVTRRNKENSYLITHVPIPFYFYERLADNKDQSPNSDGFMLDSVTENIGIEYPDTPSTSTKEFHNQDNNIIRMRNTIEASFRVKMNSTLVSVMRMLMKRVLTNIDFATDVRFSFFWNEYIMSRGKCLDYNEAPVSGTNLTLLKFKWEHYEEAAGATPQTPKTSPTPGGGLDYTNIA